MKEHLIITKVEMLEVLKNSQLYSLQNIRDAKKGKDIYLSEPCTCDKEVNHIPHDRINTKV